VTFDAIIHFFIKLLMMRAIHKVGCLQMLTVWNSNHKINQLYGRIHIDMNCDLSNCFFLYQCEGYALLSTTKFYINTKAMHFWVQQNFFAFAVFRWVICCRNKWLELKIKLQLNSLLSNCSAESKVVCTALMAKREAGPRPDMTSCTNRFSDVNFLFTRKSA
jgi:hypothetical protein